MSKNIKWVQPGVVIYLSQAGQRKIWRYRYRYTDAVNRVVEVNRSAKTAELSVAKQRAWHNYRQNTEVEVKPSVFDGRLADCQAVINCYRSHIATEDGARTSPETIKGNSNAFSRFVRLAFGREPSAVSVAALDGQAVKRWRSARYRDAGLLYGRDEDLRLNYSLNSTWQHIKGLFSKAAMRLYERELGMRLDLGPFLRVSRLVEFSPRYEPIPDGVVAAIDRDSMEIDPAARIVYELARFCGLTKREILSIRWSWIEGPADAPVLAIRYREAVASANVPAWKSKMNSKHGRLALDPSLVAGWRELAPCADPYGFIVPRDNETAAHDLVRSLNAWLGNYLGDRTKKLHELRKHAGSEVLTRTGSIVEAAAFLRDSIKTTEKHYATFLRPVAGLSRYDLPEVRSTAIG